MSFKKRMATIVATVLAVVALIIGGVTLAFAASGDVPDHAKILTVNEDGTYTIALNVTGDSEKKVQKVNVIVVFDTSSSMNTSTGNAGTVTYTATTSNGNNLYGTLKDNPDIHADADFFELTRRGNQGSFYTYPKEGSVCYRQSNFSGTYGLVNGEYVQLTQQGNNWYYNGQRYTGDRYVRYDDCEQYTGTRYTRSVGSQSRLQAAEEAVNSLASALLSKNGTEGNPSDTVQMALVDFANMAEIVGNPNVTTSYDTFSGWVNSRNAGNNNRGTNWEAGLRTAATVNFNDTDPTYVIFVSDGNPTFYLQDPGNTTQGGDGQEGNTNVTTSYNQAVPAAQSLAQKVGAKNFYTIGVYGNVDRMESLTTAAGAPSTNYYPASDTAALQAALGDILNQIEMAGIGAVEMTDGTTSSVTTTTGQISNLLTVDESSYRYYRAGGSYSDINDYDPDNGEYGAEWTDAPAATFENGAVKWDLKSEGVLENDVTYTVTFDCWPSQTTLDIVADIKNDPSAYSKLDANIKNYINPDGSLKTNTTGSISYIDTRTGQSGNQDYENPDPVATSAVEELAITKKWSNAFEDKDKEPITLNVTRDGANTYTISLNSTNNWKDSVYISIGILRHTDDGTLTDSAGAKYEVLEKGHDFTFTEPKDLGYYWEIEVPVVRPMMIDGVLTMLILKDADHTNPDNATEYTIDGKTYYVGSTGSASLTATNHRRSRLNLTKVVDGEDANPNQTFPFTLNVVDSKASEGSANDLNSDYYVWFSVWNGGYVDSVVSGATKEYDSETGEWTGYYYAPSGTNIVVNLKAGDNLRFLNLPTDSTYTFTEGTMPANYTFTSSVLTGGTDSSFKGAKTTTGTIADVETDYVVTYTNTYGLTDIEITKVWSDNSNQDGKRPTVDAFKAMLTLKADGTDVTSANSGKLTVTDNGDDTFTIKWTGLDRYANDKEIVYTVEESAIQDYTTEGSPAQDKGTITNTHTPETIDIPVEKVWVGPKGDAVTVTLYAGGSATQNTVTLNAGNNWKGTFEGLPKYANGSEIAYSVVEAGVSGVDTTKYSVAITGSAAAGYTITNTNTETVDVVVYKVWDDGSNQDGIRPTSLTLTLNGAPSGTTVPTPTVSKSSDGNTWTYTWAGLPKYTADGTEITYTVTEDTAPQGYEKSGSPASNGGTITNKHTPEETEATVTKVWDDKDDQDRVRPTSLEVTLSNGQKVTLTASNQWTATITGLPKNANGQPITYTWTEGTMPEGYSLTNTKVEGTVTTLTNSYDPQKTSVSVAKVWDDKNNQDGYRPTSLTVKLLANGEETGQSVTLSADNNWTDTIAGLDVNAAGQAISYTWDEGTIDNYTLSKQETDENGKTTLTNTHTTETVNVTVTKVWEDANNQDNLRPTSITVNLKAGDTVVGTANLTADTGWTYTWENLDKKSGGTDIVYTVEEVEVENYDSEISGDATEGYFITNTHEINTTEITVTKVWDDANNQDGKRPTSITVKLLADGQETGKTAVLNEANEWTNKFENLPVNKAGAVGQAIVYTVSEDQVTDYEQPVITGDATQGFVVTNSHTPEKTTVTVTKTWNDADNQDGIRPTSITVTLLADGKESGTATLSESNGWSYTWENLDKNAGGKAISYTVSEDQVSGYDKPEITGTATDGYTIKNTHTPETTEVTVTKVWDDADDKDGIRPESVTIALLANGTDTGKTVTLSEDNDWTDTFTDLAKNNKGQAIKYTVQELEVEGYEATVEGDATEGFTVTNTHEVVPTPVISDPPVQKIVTGDKPEKDATFKFQMKAITEGAPMPEGSVDGVKTVEIVGAGSYEFGEMTFTEPGEYVYEITEVDTGESGYTYDKTAYTLTVLVVEDEDGNLVKTETVTDNEGNEAESAVFTNTYSAPKQEEKPPATPKTGDATPMAAIQLMMGFAAATLVGASVLRTRTRED